MFETSRLLLKRYIHAHVVVEIVEQVVQIYQNMNLFDLSWRNPNLPESDLEGT